MSARFRARSAVAAGMPLLLLLALAAPAWGSHTTGHAHSVAAEITSNRGGASTRWDNTMAGIPNNGCVNPISGSPMYQSMWIRTGGPGWLELGTGHQCQDSFRYWYWGWGNSSGTWALLGWQNVPGTQKHEFRIERLTNLTTWRFFVDATQLSGAVQWNINGTRAEAGLETYTATGQTLNNGVPGTQNYEVLKVKNTSNNWAFWSGQDSQLAYGTLCGNWVSATTWRTGANVTC